MKMTDDVRGIDKLTARRIWGGREWMDGYEYHDTGDKRATYIFYVVNSN